MGQDQPTFSTHILDTAAGAPAAGVAIRLWRIGAGEPVAVGGGTTDADGRIADLLHGAPLLPGAYRLEFLLDGPFFTRVALDLRIDDVSRGYHVPLLLAPYGISSYRGS